jgi:alkane 1-monooxygenase
MILFVLSTCLPAFLIAIAAVFAGPWPVMAMLSLTLMVAGLDHLVARVTAPLPEQENRSADVLSALLAIIHLTLVPLVVWALSGGFLSSVDKICLFIASGIFFGQISNANAHELIHRRKRLLFRLGTWTYISLLFGHHVSAHLLIHHRLVGTRADPSTSRLGESYYRYAARAWLGSFTAAYKAEARRLQQVQRSPFETPFTTYALGAVLFLAIAYAVGGGIGVAWFLGVVMFAQQQLLLCDYVQHYGLQRRHDASGRLEPIGDRHSWNAPHWYSAGMMLNAPRHSDHHAHPYRPYPMLAMSEQGPVLPRSLPVMAVLALFPPAWRRVMDPRAQHWKDASAP